jgi:Exocyst complex component Sec10
MLNLFDRCYRKGDPKMMHVRSPMLLKISKWTRIDSTAHKRFLNLMAVPLAFKFMLINTTSLSTACEKPVVPTTICCSFFSSLFEGFKIAYYLYASYLCRWTSLPDPDANLPKTETGLQDLFSEIRSTVDQEAQIVKFVFPNPPFVMQVFLQRVFAQSVRLLFSRRVQIYRV